MIHLDKIEFWILSEAVMCGYPVSFLASEEDTSEFEFSYMAAIRPTELLDAFLRLQSQGDLIVWYSSAFGPKKPPIELTLTLPQLEMAIALDTGMSYTLTKRGGDRWEAWSHPDWSRVMTIGEDFGQHTETWAAKARSLRTLSSPNQQLIRDYVEVLARRGAIKGQVTWKELQPFRVTYWKSLPIGYQAHFEYEENREAISETEAMLWDELERTYSSTLWYSDPLLQV